MNLKDHIRKVAPSGFINSYHLLKAVLANFVYGFPGKKLKVYGVTGTNGKTSTAIFLHSILEASGKKTGLATTAVFSDSVVKTRNKVKMTTMSPFALNKLLRGMLGKGAKEAVIEVTSHALEQHRVKGINFDTVLFTNLTHDHLDYHKTKEAYRVAKEKLFAFPHRVSVVNADDPQGHYFLEYDAKEKLVYSLSRVQRKHQNKLVYDKRIYASDVTSVPKGVNFTLHFGLLKRKIFLKTPGLFNVYNALAATTAALGSDISLSKIKKGLELVEVLPGRLEELDFGQPFKVYIDYAHTPDALKQVFESIKPIVRGKLIHVGGATGNRDKSKRVVLGALAGKFADIRIVTNEDPDNEDPTEIIEQVAEGVVRGAPSKSLVLEENFFKIDARASAIAHALSLANKGDVVLITGKGDETSMIVDGKLLPYSDREEVEKALKSQRKK